MLKRAFLGLLTAIALASQVLAGSIAGVPSWVQGVCPNYTPGTMCLDFVASRAWDGIAGAITTPGALLSITRPSTETYVDASGAFSTIPNGQLAIGNGGLQIYSLTNYLSHSAITTSGGGLNSSWHTDASGISAPAYSYHSTGGPDGGSYTTVDLVAASAGGQHSQIASQFSVTSGTQMTCGFWARGHSTSVQFLMSLQNPASNAYLGSKIIVAPAVWSQYSVTAIANGGTLTFLFGTVTVGNGLSNGQSSQMPITRWGGQLDVSLVQCNPGTALTAFQPTTGRVQTIAVDDDISAIGNLATALDASEGTLVVTTTHAMEAVAATFIGNNGEVFLGKTGSGDTATATPSGAALSTGASGNWLSGSTITRLAWSSQEGQIQLNGSAVVRDKASRRMSGMVYLGSTDGSSGLLNGRILSLAVYPSAQPLEASISQPITGISLGGYLDYAGNYNSGGFSANVMYNYNVDHSPSSYIIGDTWATTWAGDGSTYMTSGDTQQFLNSHSNNTALEAMNYTSWSDSAPDKVVGVNSADFSSYLGTLGQSRTCRPPYTSWRCEWKPTGILAIQASDISTSATQDAVLMALSRQWEFPQPQYGDVYSTLIELRSTLSRTYSPALSSVSSWSGLPAKAGGPNRDVAGPTFGSNSAFNHGLTGGYFGIFMFVSYPAQNYAPISTPVNNPDDQNHYVYALLFNPVIGPKAICVRIALRDLSIASNAYVVDKGGNPSYWEYYQRDGRWSARGIDAGGDMAWNQVIANAQNVIETSTNPWAFYFSDTYIPASNRYLMLGHVSAWPAALSVIEAPHPWGPYNVVQAIPDPVVPNFYFPNLIQASLSVDNGRTAWVNLSGTPAFGGSASVGLYTLWQAPIEIHN